ncbi:hypothetical protein QFZ98_003934 [Paraburkholderia youngii]
MNQNREPIAIDTESHINPPPTITPCGQQSSAKRGTLATHDDKLRHWHASQFQSARGTVR